MTGVLLLAGLVGLMPVSGAASASGVVIGSTTLTANSGTANTMGKNIPVFQGSASGSYVTSSPVNGMIVSWSFRSAGVTKGDRFVLRVLQPAGSSGTSWKAVGTSAPATVTSDTGTDALLGPFSTSVTIATGDVIALQPIDEDSTPIEAGINGKDGIRYFTSPVSDGSTEDLAPGATSNNGQVVPIQATVDVAATITTTTTTTTATTTTAPATTTAQPVAVKNIIAPHVTGVAASGQTVTCDPGSWTGKPTLSYSWYWRQTTRVLPFTLKPKLPSFGLKRTLFASSSYFLHPATFSAHELARLGTAKTLSVPDLPTAGATVGCTVTAKLGTQTVSADSGAIASRATVPALILQERLHNGTIKTFPPPQITPGLAAGSTNTCTPGSWAHYPNFTYAWYTLGPRIPGQLVRSRTLRARGQTLGLADSDVGSDIQCVVTAINAAGSNKAATNDYVVPPTPLKALQPPFVDVTTQEPSFRGGEVGPEGAQIIAEQVDLTCDNGRWQGPADTSFQMQWIWIIDGQAIGPLTSGDSDDFDMRPGNTQYNITVECEVTATTNHTSATSDSGPINVWNGCNEVAVPSGGSPPDPVATSDTEVILDLATYPFVSPLLAAAGVVDASLPLFGTGTNSNSLQQVLGDLGVGQTQIDTYGPNCEDYQKYLMGQGYTVKQQPGDGP